MADFEYFRAEESDQFSFFRIPKALFTEKEFASLSTDAKLLYGILLDRISLSKKNGWIDSDGYVYIIYTIAELQELLRMSHTTVTNAITDSADFMVAPLIGNILVMINKACCIKDDVVMDMIFVNMGTDHVFIFSFQYFICKLLPKPVSSFCINFSRFK